MPKAGNAKDWRNDPDFCTFVQWSCMNTFERDQVGQEPWCLKYQYEMADYLGVNPDTLRRWRKRPEFDELRQEMADEWLSESRPQRIRAAIYSAQIPGKEGYNDRRDLFHMDGSRDETNRSEITIEHHIEVQLAVRSMTHDELEKNLIEGLREMPELEGKSDDELRGLIKAIRKLTPGRGAAARRADEKHGLDPDDWRQSDEEIEEAEWFYADDEPAPDPYAEDGES